MRSQYFGKLFILLLVGVLPGKQVLSKGPELMMSTQGYMLFAPHIHGLAESISTNSGYRLELRALTDIIKWNQTYLSFITANKTLIKRSVETGPFTLDEIKYSLSPDLRIEYDTWLLRVSYLHESLHTVSHATIGGTQWMNSLQVAMGTKGSNYLFIWEEYKNNHDRFLNHLDALAFAGVFRKSNGSIWVGRNHDYKYKVGGRLRFQIGSFNKWAYFMGTDLTGWYRETGDWEGTGVLKLNMFRKGKQNLGGLYYAYNFYDSFQADNEQHLGSLGLQIIF